MSGGAQSWRPEKRLLGPGGSKNALARFRKQSKHQLLVVTLKFSTRPRLVTRHPSPPTLPDIDKNTPDASPPATSETSTLDTSVSASHRFPTHFHAIMSHGASQRNAA